MRPANSAWSRYWCALPQAVDFNPECFQFAQAGRRWQPSGRHQNPEIISLEKDGRFGGEIKQGEVHQGVILLPPWLDPKTSFDFGYGDFNWSMRLLE